MTSHPHYHSLMSFLDNAPTPWHAVASLSAQLQSAAFISQSEQHCWSLVPGGRYFTTRDGSSLCAFIMPRNRPRRIRLIASHLDSPGLKIKPHPEMSRHQMIVWGVEVYGSPLLSSWLNRDLGIAGRLIYEEPSGRWREAIIRIDDWPLVIPQLAIHLDRDVNERGVQLNKQEHLHALASLQPSDSTHSLFTKLLQQQVGEKPIIDHDLFLFPLEPARLLGNPASPFLAAYRIDSLASVNAATHALCTSTDPLDDEIKMVVYWNHEEIGSHTAQGAASPFFSEILTRLLTVANLSREEQFCLVQRSLCLSVDLAHALHPNFVDRHDPLHAPRLGGGVVIKSHANQRYATTARAVFPLYAIARRKNLPLQRFVSRNDLPCGTTIGPIHAQLTGMPTVDLGTPQLSMHASRELMACADHDALCHLLGGFFEAEGWPEEEEGMLPSGERSSHG